MGKTKPKKNTIRFKCTKCGCYLKVSDRFANRYIECPKCKGRTGVPGSQEEADAEGGEYGVKELAVDVPDECDKCGEPLPDGSVFCTACGYDYRKGKFQEGVEEIETENAFIAWIRDVSWNRVASAAVVVAILGGLGFSVVNFMHQRSSGGIVNRMLYDTLSQMSTEQNVKDTFGSPKERIKIVGVDLGGEKFLSLETDADKVRAAGLDPEALKQEGFTMVCDVKAEKDTLMMIGKPDISYFLFYANDEAAMMVQLEADTKTGSEQVCNWAAMLESDGQGGYSVFCDGMGPVYGAGGDFRGFYWTQFFAEQVIRPDTPDPNLTYNPQACWNVWKKAELRDFKK